jgi:hypothetical protein
LACGGSVDPSSASEATTIGWRDVDPAPPRGRGTLYLSSRDRTGSAELTVAAGDVAPRTLSVFAWFVESPEPRFLFALGPGQRAATFALDRTQCETKANLIAVEAAGPILDWTSVAGGTLVGVSQKGKELFPQSWDFDVAFPCQAGDHPLPPLRLEDDPRLPLALCRSKETGPVRCGTPVLDVVRIREGRATVSADGLDVSLEPEYVPPGETPRVFVDGAAVEGLSFRLPLSTLGRDLAISVAIGARRPFGARLRTPATPLGLELGVLRPKTTFVVKTAPRAWAEQWLVSVTPTTPTKEGFGGSAAVPLVSVEFPGFESPGTSARVRVDVTSARKGFWIEQVEERVVPIE